MKTPSPPKQPKFNPIDIPATLAQAIQFDLQGYEASDADFQSRFPGLVTGRNMEINDAYHQLVDPTNPTVQNTFTQQGIEKALGVTGEGGNMAGVTPGAASGNTAAGSITASVNQKQDYDRARFQDLITRFPARGFGLSGGDVASLSIANTGGLNANNQIAYQNQLNSIAAQGAYGVQTGQAISSLGSIFSGLSGILNYGGATGYRPSTTTAGGWSDSRLKRNIQRIGTSEAGYPIYEFEYVDGKGLPEGLHQGVIAQDILLIKPEAVEYHADGYMTVDYSQLDVKHKKL